MPDCPAQDRCSEPVDIIIRSSEGQEFGAHRAYLSFFSAGFPPMPAEYVIQEASEEIVGLDESTKVVSVLLQFMHPRQPSIRSIPHGDWPGIADAAEKYQVLSAIDICKEKMAELIDVNAAGALDTLVYATRHDHHDLVFQAGVRSLNAELPIAEEKLGREDLFFAWLHMREQRQKFIPPSIASLPKPLNHTIPGERTKKCHIIDDFYYAFFHDIAKPHVTPKSIQHVYKHAKVKVQGCTTCKRNAEAWVDKLEMEEDARHTDNGQWD